MHMEDGTQIPPGHTCDTVITDDVRKTLNLVSDRWTLPTVATLRDGPLRYAEIRRQLGTVSQRMLTRTLRQLERDALVQRTVFPTVPPSVEYTLTDLGRSLSEALRPLIEWAIVHEDTLSASRASFDPPVPRLHQPS